MNTMCGGERHDPYPLAPDAAAELLARAPWRRFVVLGDDLAEGGDPRKDRDGPPWADRVAAALRSVRPELAYLNLGRRELTAARIRARQLARALTFRPDLAAVAAGGSDVLDDSFDADATEAELARLLGPLRDAGVEVVVLAPFCGRRSARHAAEDQAVLHRRLRLLAERTRDLALRNGVLHVDLGARPVRTGPDLFGADGRHLDAHGHAVAAATVVRCLGARLDGQSARP